MIVRKTLEQAKLEDSLASFKAVKVIKTTESLRNRQSLQETKKL